MDLLKFQRPSENSFRPKIQHELASSDWLHGIETSGVMLRKPFFLYKSFGKSLLPVDYPSSPNLTSLSHRWLYTKKSIAEMSRLAIISGLLSSSKQTKLGS